MKQLALLSALALALSAAPARAAQPEHGSSPAPAAAHHGAAHHVLVGVTGGVQHLFATEHAEGLTEPGAGLFAAWVASPVFEIELTGKVFFGPHTAVPLELLFKRTFGHGLFQPFVGAGPMALLVTGEHPELELGAAAAAGTYVWFAQNLGLVAEATGGLLLNEGHVEPEAGLGLGFVMAF